MYFLFALYFVTLAMLQTKRLWIFEIWCFFKGKGTLICIASHRMNPWIAQVWITQLLNCKAHHTCLYRVVCQSATTEWTEHQLMKLTTHLSTPCRRKLSWCCWLTYIGLLPISCRSGADQWKFASQRPTFYHWATQSVYCNHPTSVELLSSACRNAKIKGHQN